MTKSSKTTQKTSKKVAKPYARTEAEDRILQQYNDRKARKSEVPEISLEKHKDSNQATINIKIKDAETGSAILHSAFGTTDERFFKGLATQFVNVAGRDPQNFDFMLSIIGGIEPKDEIEAMLAAQMAAVHMQTMAFARRLTCVENVLQQDSAERAFNKLARTFTTQLEALNRYRGKGQQKMTVEHVHVNEGGQAIIGTVEGGGGKNKKGGQPHALRSKD